jgi:general secretion pathway protein D
MKNKHMNTKRTITTLLLIFIIVGSFQISHAQQGDVPREFREYTNPKEMVSFHRETSFRDAIEVLNQFSQEFQNKIIVDRSGYSGPIGISLPAMYWRDALDFILRVQNLVALESSDMIEVVTTEEAQQRESPRLGRQAAGAGITDEIIANTRTREVRINATFFEGNRRALQEIGVDWSTLSSNVPDNVQSFVGDQQSGGGSGGSSGGSGGQQEGQLPTTEFDGRFVSVNTKGAQSVSQNVFNALVNFGDVGAGIEVQALFSAFEADNLGQILATPSIKVMDGEEGRIQVGQDFSIKQRDIAGNVTDQFFSTGTILNVTPQVITQDDTTFVYLQIDTERSSAQPDPVSTIINKQTATTHSLLLDGESTVIAGLFRTERTEVRRGIPILKDLPPWFFGLRYLFGFNSIDNQEAELIVLLQAELEDSIPERMRKKFKSKQELLDLEKERHRNEFDQDLFDDLNDEKKEKTEADSVITDMIEEKSSEPETAEKQPEKTVQTIEPKTESSRENEKNQILNQSDVDKKDISDFAGEWKPVEATNMNNGYENLEFYVIGGSFTVRENAFNLFEKFKSEGYNAHMLYNPATNYYFVAYAGFENSEKALEYTRRIQDEIQSQAWLSRIIRESRLDVDKNG